MTPPWMPASCKKAGVAQAFPNVCFIQVPPPVNQVPLPFASVGQLANADDTIDVVLIENKETVVQRSKIPSTKGDEGGNKKGVISGVNTKCVVFRKVSPNVYAGGRKIVHVTAATGQNGENPNAFGMQVVASQDVVLVGI